MCTTEPIRDKKQMQKLVKYFEKNGQTRNCAMVTLGFATALRITDELSLTWGDVYDFGNKHFLTHFEISERKTGKPKQVKINRYVREILKKLLEEIKRVLNIEVGQTTPDGKFSLDCLRCVGACGLAPVVTIGDKVYGRLQPKDVKKILEEYND